MKHELVVGINDCIVSSDPNAVLITHALGSCVGVVIYDPEAKVGGLLHCMLPDSGLDSNKASQTPFMFADTGLPLLFNKAYRAGARKNRLVVTILGGAQIIVSDHSFDIGKHNVLAVRKVLCRAGVVVQHEDVGGSNPRTAKMELATGQIVVSFGKNQRRIL